MANSPSAAIAECDSKQDANAEVPFETFETIKEAKVSKWVKASRYLASFVTFLRVQLRLTEKLLAKW